MININQRMPFVRYWNWSYNFVVHELTDPWTIWSIMSIRRSSGVENKNRCCKCLIVEEVKLSLDLNMRISLKELSTIIWLLKKIKSTFSQEYSVILRELFLRYHILFQHSRSMSGEMRTALSDFNQGYYTFHMFGSGP